MANTISGATTPPPVGSATPTTPGTIPSNPKGQLGKDEFLKLLVAQMQNQDPLNPQDGQEMAEQMAQFSSVEQLVEMNANFKAQQAAQSSLAEALGNSMTLGMIGQNVQVDPAQVTDARGNPVPEGTVIEGRVDGVRFTLDGPMLTIGEYQFPYGAIIGANL